MSLPQLPIKGINPFDSLSHNAEKAYLSYERGTEFVNKNLHRNPREHKSDFQRRKSVAYYLQLVYRITSFLTKTIDNDKYVPLREFGKLVSLTTIAERSAPDGTHWESALKEAAIEMLLGGLAYIFIDRRAIGPRLESEIDVDLDQGRVEAIVIRGSQVNNCILTSDGYYSQCDITEELIDKSRVIRYWTTDKPYLVQSADPTTGQLTQPTEVPAGTPIYEVYEQRKDIDPDYIRTDSGFNDLGVAPLVPCFFEGKLRKNNVTSPIHRIVDIEISILNHLSGMDEAFNLHIFPRMAMPRPAAQVSTLIGDQDRKTKDEESKAVGSAWGIYYDKDTGPPIILEPSGVHVDVTFKLIDQLKAEILQICGLSDSNATDPSASGLSKSWDFIDTNDTHRLINSCIQRIEYQAWYLVARAKEPQVPSFADFVEEVKIKRPTNFDPVGGLSWQRLHELANSTQFQSLPITIKNAVLEALSRQALREIIPHSELDELIEKGFAELEKQQQEVQTNAGTNEPTNPTSEPTEPEPARQSPESSQPATGG